MKKVVFGILAGFMVLLPSCLDIEDDNYSLGKFWVQFGTVNKQGSESYTVSLDDGSVIYPVYGNFFGSKLDEAERVLVNYTILSNKLKSDTLKEYYVKINSLKTILKKGILDLIPAIEDSIGNDPIVVHDVWVSKNQLLNFQIKYYGNYKVHFINLVKQPGNLTADKQPVQLELKHNENDDHRDYFMTGFVTFDLSAIQIPGIDSVRFKVESKDYSGKTNTFEGVYHY